MENEIICSIIIPAYNAEKTLVKCLNSIQVSLLQERKIEIIIINDGSSDDTQRIAEEYLKNTNSGFVINKLNGGVSSARNVGIDNAHGKYLYFCDADDVIVCKTLFLMIEYAEKNLCDVVVAKYIKSNEDHYTIDNLPSYQLLNRTYIEKEILPLYVKGEGISSIWNKLYRKDIIDKNNIKFNELRSLGEDWEFNLDFFRTAESMYVINDIIYVYMQDGTQGDFNKYNKYLEYSLVHNYKKAVQLNNEYKFFSENSFEFKNMTRRFVCLCIGYLELENVSRNQKIKFLKNEYVLGAIHLLLKLKKRELPGWTRRNHFSMILLKLKLYRLLILLHYKLKLNLIPR